MLGDECGNIWVTAQADVAAETESETSSDTEWNSEVELRLDFW
jgi:hypothetical protein